MPDTWRPEPHWIPHFILYLSRDTKVISTVAKPGLGWPKGCLILPVAPPTTSAFPTPSTLHLLLSLPSWKLPAHTISGHTPHLLRFLGQERNWHLREARSLSPSAQASPAGDGAGSQPPREAPPDAETKNAKLAVCTPQGEGRTISNYIPGQELDQKL